jgi:hypothetical protein
MSAIDEIQRLSEALPDSPLKANLCAVIGAHRDSPPIDRAFRTS